MWFFCHIVLQQQLNILRDTAKKLGLVVNLQKSNVVVFRNGGHIAAREKWFYDGMKLEIVNQYKYLGVIFFYRVNILIRSWRHSQQGKKGRGRYFETSMDIGWSIP